VTGLPAEEAFPTCQTLLRASPDLAARPAGRTVGRSADGLTRRFLAMEAHAFTSRAEAATGI
jgi:hypothetical protein